MEDIANDTALSRYAVETRLGIAIAAYVIDDGRMTFTHTEVPAALEGRGIASRLIKFALTDARERGLKVVPQCSFVHAYIDKHPEWRNLLAS